MDTQLAAYIVENRYGNFVPFLSSIHPSPGDDDSTLFPQAQGMACIKLEDAQDFLKNNLPEEYDTLLFLQPVKHSDTGILWLSQLTSAT